MQQMNPGQVKKYIKQLRQRQEQYVYYLGQLAYQAGEQGKLEEGPLLDAYRTLKDIQEQIAGWESYLERMRAPRVMGPQLPCPRCGTPVTPGAGYCPRCGQPIISVAPQAGPFAPPGVPPVTVQQYGVPTAPPGPVTFPGPAPTGPVFSPAQPRTGGPPPVVEMPAAERRAESPCPNCGAPLDAGAVFCGNCGARVGAEVQASAPWPEAGESVSPAAVGEEVAERTDQVTETPYPEERVPTAVSSEAVSLQAGTQAEAGAAVLRCSACGAVVDDPEARFCPDCGSALQG